MVNQSTTLFSSRTVTAARIYVFQMSASTQSVFSETDSISLISANTTNLSETVEHKTKINKLIEIVERMSRCVLLHYQLNKTNKPKIRMTNDFCFFLSRHWFDHSLVRINHIQFKSYSSKLRNDRFGKMRRSTLITSNKLINE